VPECMRLDVLLEEFQQGGYRLAVVVDEYGGTAGVVTRGDILEEIVGDMDDRHGGHKLDIEPMGPGHWLVDAAISLEELNEELDLKLKADGVDRLAGWFVAHLERLPRPGEAVVAQGCRAIVRQMRRHRIILIELSRLDPGEDA
jgi:putative hemolysin